MFGGFNPFPGKPGAKQKPLGVVQDPHNTQKQVQKPLGVIPSPHEPISAPQRPAGVLDQAGQPSRPPAAQGTSRKAIETEALWDGIIHGWSGYAKASRELIKRVSVYARIRFADDAYWDPSDNTPDHVALYKFHRQIPVGPKAPRITFLPPKEEKKTGYRIIYTMMETEICHPAMIRLMNERYEECWVPTRWNAGTFQRSGLELPIYVMPLGVDPSVYHPGVAPFIPKATLMTGVNAGRQEIPKGFLFVNVFQPSFRKGHDVLIQAFEEGFANDPEAGLILGTTAYSLQDSFPWKSMKSRIWTLPGGYSEKQLSSVYRGCQAYVCTSRGEGWNMPNLEAAAVGLPVIVPRTSVHPELVPSDCGFFFDSDSKCTYPKDEVVSPWFGDGIEFPEYGPKSKKQLIGLMRQVKKNYPAALKVGEKFRTHVTTNLTWSIAARKIAGRLQALCARA
jgi:glycosyltransferase involved in cell wall biosynthesis